MLIGKNNGIINLSNPITGKNICSVDGITDASFTCNCETEYVYNSDNKKIFSFTHNPTYELKFNANNTINKKKIEKVFGIDLAKCSDVYSVQYIKYVQIRRHKKKRINKKWIKRYGYKQIMVETKGWKTKCYTDGSIEFIRT